MYEERVIIDERIQTDTEDQEWENKIIIYISPLSR